MVDINVVISNNVSELMRRSGKRSLYILHQLLKKVPGITPETSIRTGPFLCGIQFLVQQRISDRLEDSLHFICLDPVVDQDLFRLLDRFLGRVRLR